MFSRKFLKNLKKVLTIHSLSGIMKTVKRLTNTAAGARKEKNMDENMNQSETVRDETEQKMIYKILLMIKESKNLEELEEKVKALLNK